ncbi:hypothetical protein QOL99_05465 [Deinococcus sp. MIMF12]|uniref:Uncharacterized protein n=1 Tax=Deinococcus rhizophilus TaxID=3049544 RepID=A0ABT7JEW7_9DEIO|nr:hypothetical protein [Deinococcus rhizophilus]MDL2343597.1 hypothetical protein [Deinococcus rhizophilus]
MNLSRPLALTSALLLAGAFAPALVPAIPAGLSADERIFARHALRNTSNLLDNPAQRLLTLRLRVVSVIPEGVPSDCGELPFVSHQRYRGTVQALTVFGIPYQTFSATCEGV